MRYCFISLIYIAFAIQLGHDIIPHHHGHSNEHHQDNSTGHHHPIDHNHGDENQTGSDFVFGHVLPVIMLASGMETSRPIQFVDSTDTNTSIDFKSTNYWTIAYELVPAAANPPPYPSTLSKNVDLAGIKLRGPPSSSV